MGTAIRIGSLLAVAAVGVGAAGETAASERGRATPPPFIVFASNADGDTDVYVVSAAGGPIRALTTNNDEDNVAAEGGTVVREWRGTVYALRPDGGWRPLGSGDLRGLAQEGHRVIIEEVRHLLVTSPDGRYRRRVRITDYDRVSPDGRHVVFFHYDDGRESAAILVDIGTGERRRLAAGGETVDFSPSGRFVTLRRSDRRGTRVRMVDTTRVLPTRQATAQSIEILWSPDETRVAIFSGDYDSRSVSVLDLRTGVRRGGGSGIGSESPTWSPDGTRIAYVRQSSGGRAALAVLDARLGHERVLLQRSRYGIGAPAWSPTSRRLAFSLTIGKRPVVAVVRATGGVPRLLPGRTFLAWTPDGARLLVQSGRTITLVGVAGNVHRRATIPFDSVGGVAWAPDGETYALYAAFFGRSIYAAAPTLRSLTERGGGTVLAWRRALPERARPAPRVTPGERVEGRLLTLRGPVVDISAYGPFVGVLVGDSELECTHPLLWRERGAATFVGIPMPCPEGGGPRPLGVQLSRESLQWWTYGCGNSCYTHGYEVKRAALQARRYLGEDTTDDAPELAPTEPITRRGVTAALDNGVVRVTHADGRETTIRAPGARVFTFDLEDVGLFYAYNRFDRAWPGRIAFVPFDELLPEAA